MAIPHGVSFASVQAKLATYVIRHCTRVIETQKKKKKISKLTIYIEIFVLAFRKRKINQRVRHHFFRDTFNTIASYIHVKCE